MKYDAAFAEYQELVLISAEEYVTSSIHQSLHSILRKLYQLELVETGFPILIFLSALYDILPALLQFQIKMYNCR